MKTLRAISVQMRQIFSWKLLLCMVSFTLMHLATTGKILFDGSQGAAFYYFDLSEASGIGHLTFYVLPCIPFSMSLSQDWDDHAVPYWVTRSGCGTYVFSKFLSAAAAGALTVLGGMLLYYIPVGLAEGGFVLQQEFGDPYMDAIVRGGSALLYHGMYFLHYMMGAATVAMLGMLFSVFFTNRFVGITAPLAFYLLISRLTPLSIPTRSIFFPACWFHIIHHSGGAFQVFGEKVLLTLILWLIMCTVGIFFMKRRLRHA